MTRDGLEETNTFLQLSMVTANHHGYFVALNHIFSCNYMVNNSSKKGVHSPGPLPLILSRDRASERKNQLLGSIHSLGCCTMAQGPNLQIKFHWNSGVPGLSIYTLFTAAVVL